MSAASAVPIRVAIANDYEIVVAGLAQMLSPYADRLEVVELSVARAPSCEVDVVLYDTFGRTPDDEALAELLDAGRRTVIFTWLVEAAAVTRAIDAGAAGCVSKACTAEELVEALEAVCTGETVVRSEAAHGTACGHGDWPGREAGLSPRESETLTYIAQGLSNREIAEHCYLSVNSVKTYIRSSYRKIGADRRSQAILWALRHGLEPAPDDAARDDTGTGRS